MGERVWDRFLTDQDREDMRTRPRGRVGFGERPAVLMVDLYRWVFGDRPLPLLEARKEWPLSCGLAGWDALPHLIALRDGARAAGIPIVYCRDNPSSGIRDWQKWSGGKHSIDTDESVDQSSDKWAHRFDLMEEVGPRPEDVVIMKSAPSAFWSTPLLAHLIANQVDTLIVGGETTSGCLRASVVDGCSYRLRMIVAEECAFDRHEASHAINLFDMNQKYADVLPLSEILDYLGRLGASESSPPPTCRGGSLARASASASYAMLLARPGGAS